MAKRKSVWLFNQFAGTPQSGWGERHYYLTKDLVSEAQRIIIISSGNNHMFNNETKLKGLFTYENHEGVEFLWIWLPPYNPRNFTRFFAMFFFAFACFLVPFKVRLLGLPKVIMLSSMSIFPLPALLLIKRLFQVPKFVFEVRDLWPLTPIHLMGISKKNPLIRLIAYFEKLAYRKADSIISLFEEAEPYINSISGDPTKFNWLPNGVSSSLLREPSIKDLPLLDTIPEGKLVFCYTGTLGFANAMEPFFEALRSKNEALENAYFLIVGDGYLKEKFKSKCEGLKNVIFTGKVPKNQIPQILQKVDICFIAWHESELYKHGVSANKYFDYLGMGKPVLSAQVGIIDPVIKSGAGIQVENSTEGILKGICEFLEMSKTQRTQMGDLGRTYIHNHHLYEKLSEKFQAILNV